MRKLAYALTLLALQFGCAPKSATPAPPTTPTNRAAGAAFSADRQVQWSPCRVERLSQALECATVQVPEGDGGAAGETLPLQVVRAKATRPKSAEDPLYFIAGGPGQGASRVVFSVLAALSRVRRDRDIVFVDVRGTGRSAPLDCDPAPPDEQLAEAFAATWSDDQLKACKKRHEGRNLRVFRTASIVRDFERVADLLGHAKVNVYGISYGTRVALEWIRRHPDRIRTAILDGVAPPQMTFFETFAEDSQAAFDKLADDCLAAPGCARRFGDPRMTLRRLLTQLRAEPRVVTFLHPRTGDEVALKITAAGVAMALRGLLYSADLQALVPLALAHAATGDYAPLAAEVLTMTQGASTTTSIGLLLEVTCAEDVARMAAVATVDGSDATFLGPALKNQMIAACRKWSPGTPTPAQARTAVTAATPVLLLSGALDPVTPPKWGALAAKTLENGRHVVVPGAAHGTFGVGCVPRLIAEFVTAGAVQELDITCVEQVRRPPFFLTRAGPAP